MRTLNVVVYDGLTSVTPLRWRGRSAVRDLRFTTQLPGGFGACSFRAAAAAARQWDLRTGQKLIVWDGRQLAWMGWVEDVTWSGNRVEVLALGPWEELQQLLISATYTDTTDDIVSTVLDSCSYVSASRSYIQPTGISLSSYAVTRSSCASVVETMCQAGNDSDQPMLFALWDPPRAREIEAGTNIMWDPGAEKGTAYGFNSRSNTNVRSGSQAAYCKWGLAGPADHPYNNSTYMDSRHVCSPSTLYIVSGWLYVSAALGAYSVTINVKWYNSGKSLLSTNTLTLAAADLPANTWTYFSFSATSHASAYYFMFSVPIVIGYTGGIWIDDVSVGLAGTSDVYDRLPIAHFWPRDLTDYDYILRGSGVSFNETTRDLANYVLATYGASSATGAAEDGASQAAYRRRDAVIAAGSNATQTLAEARRDAYLAQYRSPRVEIAGADLPLRRGMVYDKLSRPVDPVRIRAGDRLRVADGPLAGSVMLVERTEYRDGDVSVTMERYPDTSKLLARV